MERPNPHWPTSGKSHLQRFLPMFRADAQGLARAMRLLERQGRRGGALLVGLAAALGLPGGFFFRYANPWNGTDTWSPVFTFIGSFLLVAGLASAGAGARALVAPVPVAPSMDKEAFLAFLRQHQKPVHVCLKCRIALPTSIQPRPECPKCLSARECFHVTSDADVRVVAAALV